MATPLPRSQFPVTEHHIYLNHAGVAPLSQAAVDAMVADVRHVADHGSAVEPERFDRVDEVRLTAAALLGVPATDVAFVKNTTEGLAFVAEGLDLRPGQRVIVPDREFPSTLFPFLALRDRGVRVDLVQPRGPGGALPLEAFAAALDEAPTALVTVSWVQFGTGWRTDLEVLADLCHRHGALLCVDVIQGLGVLPCSLAEWGVDFAAADGHKWLLGPEGLGVLYVAAEHRDRLRVIEPGWASVAQREQWDDLRLDYDDSARRFEGGTLNVAGALGLGASLDLLAGAAGGRGVEAIWEHVDGLAARLTQGLTEAGATVLSDRSPSARSGIVTFTVEGRAPEAVVESLAGAGVVASPRGGGTRLSPHGYTTVDEIDAVIDLVRRTSS